jgi:hypothetical protein
MFESSACDFLVMGHFESPLAGFRRFRFGAYTQRISVPPSCAETHAKL